MKQIILFVLVLGVGVSFAQNKNDLLFSTQSEFNAIISGHPESVNPKLWRVFLDRAEKSFKKKDYTQALKYSTKAKILADKLGGNVIIYLSYRQIGKINVVLENYQKANGNFNFALLHLRKGLAAVPKEKHEITPETAWMYYYWGLIFSKRDHFNRNLHSAFRFFRGAYLISRSRKESGYDEVFAFASLNIGRVFGLRGNQLTKLLWVDHAKTRLSTSTNKNAELLFQILYETQDAYRVLGFYSFVEKELNKIEPLYSKILVKNKLLYLRAYSYLNYAKNNKKKGSIYLDRALELAKKSRDQMVVGYYTQRMILLYLIYGEIDEARIKLISLERLNNSIKLSPFTFPILVVKAVLAGVRGNQIESDDLFLEAEKVWVKNGEHWQNGLFLFIWRRNLARINRDFERLKTFSLRNIESAIRMNRFGFLRYMYLDQARAYFGLGDLARKRPQNC